MKDVGSRCIYHRVRESGVGRVRVKGMHVSQPRPAEHSLDGLPGAVIIRDSVTLPND